MSDQLNYIVVEGSIGVGKTTLAKRLAKHFGSDLILEAAAENPFLPKFYERPKGAALATQLFFLFQRIEQIKSMRQTDMFTPVRVADFLLEKDRLFAELTLSDEELKLYDRVYAAMEVETPIPDLVIYLQAPVEILLQRIKKRGIDHEQRMDSNYLERLNEAYIRFFYHYKTAPLLIINTSKVDFSEGEGDFAMLLSRIRKLPKGVTYFNPMTSFS